MGQTIPGEITEVRYRRTGPQRGYYVHRFEGGVRMHANRDGSVTLRGPHRIHAVDTELGFWEKYGRENPVKKDRKKYDGPRIGGRVRRITGRPGYRFHGAKAIKRFRARARGLDTAGLMHLADDYGWAHAVKRRRRNPGLLRSAWAGARYGWHTHRAGKAQRRAGRALAQLRGNPRRRRMARRGGDNSTAWLIGLGLFLYLASRPGGLQAALGGILGDGGGLILPGGGGAEGTRYWVDTTGGYTYGTGATFIYTPTAQTTAPGAGSPTVRPASQNEIDLWSLEQGGGIP